MRHCCFIKSLYLFILAHFTMVLDFQIKILPMEREEWVILKWKFTNVFFLKARMELYNSLRSWKTNVNFQPNRNLVSYDNGNWFVRVNVFIYYYIHQLELKYYYFLNERMMKAPQHILDSSLHCSKIFKSQRPILRRDFIRNDRHYFLLTYFLLCTDDQAMNAFVKAISIPMISCRSIIVKYKLLLPTLTPLVSLYVPAPWGGAGPNYLMINC